MQETEADSGGVAVLSIILRDWAIFSAYSWADNHSATYFHLFLFN